MILDLGHPMPVSHSSSVRFVLCCQFTYTVTYRAGADGEDVEACRKTGSTCTVEVDKAVYPPGTAFTVTVIAWKQSVSSDPAVITVNTRTYRRAVREL